MVVNMASENGRNDDEALLVALQEYECLLGVTTCLIGAIIDWVS